VDSSAPLAVLYDPQPLSQNSAVDSGLVVSAATLMDTPQRPVSEI